MLLILLIFLCRLVPKSIVTEIHDELFSSKNEELQKTSSCYCDKGIVNIRSILTDEGFNQIVPFTYKLMGLGLKAKKRIEQTSSVMEPHKEVMQELSSSVQHKKHVLRILTFTFNETELIKASKKCHLDKEENLEHHKKMKEEFDKVKTTPLLDTNIHTVKDLIADILELSYNRKMINNNKHITKNVNVYIETCVFDSSKELQSHRRNMQSTFRLNEYIKLINNQNLGVSMTLVFVDTCFNLAKYYVFEAVELARLMEQKTHYINFIIDNSMMKTKLEPIFENNKFKSLQVISDDVKEKDSNIMLKQSISFDNFDAKKSKPEIFGSQNDSVSYDYITMSRNSYILEPDEKLSKVVLTKIVHGFLFIKQEIEIKKKNDGDSQTESSDKPKTIQSKNSDQVENMKLIQFSFIYRIFGRDEIVCNSIFDPIHYCKIEHPSNGLFPTPLICVEMSFLVSNKPSPSYPNLKFNVVVGKHNDISHYYSFLGPLYSMEEKKYTAPIEHTPEGDEKEKNFHSIIKNIQKNISKAIQCEAKKHEIDEMVDNLPVCGFSFVSVHGSTSKNRFNNSLKVIGNKIMERVYRSELKKEGFDINKKVEIIKHFFPKLVSEHEIITYNTLYKYCLGINEEQKKDCEYSILCQNIDKKYAIIYILNNYDSFSGNLLSFGILSEIVESFEASYRKAINLNNGKAINLNNEQMKPDFIGTNESSHNNVVKLNNKKGKQKSQADLERNSEKEKINFDKQMEDMKPKIENLEIEFDYEITKFSKNVANLILKHLTIKQDLKREKVSQSNVFPMKACIERFRIIVAYDIETDIADEGFIQALESLNNDIILYFSTDDQEALTDLECWTKFLKHLFTFTFYTIGKNVLCNYLFSYIIFKRSVLFTEEGFKEFCDLFDLFFVALLFKMNYLPKLNVTVEISSLLEMNHKVILKIFVDKFCELPEVGEIRNYNVKVVLLKHDIDKLNEKDSQVERKDESKKGKKNETKTIKQNESKEVQNDELFYREIRDAIEQFTNK